MNSFIVDFWSRFFRLLGRVSVFRLVWSVLPARARTYAAVDAWVLANLFLSIAALFAVTSVGQSTTAAIIAAYAVIRVFEVTVYQINVVLFDAYRHAKAGGLAAPLKGYRRLVILILQNYTEIIFWFASLYSVAASHFPDTASGVAKAHTLSSFVGALFQSIETMATLTPTISPGDDIGRILTMAHVVVGVFVSIIVLGAVIGLLPQRPSLDDYFKNPEDAK